MAVDTPVCDFGWKAVDFDLEGVDGKRVRLADLQGPRGTLVMFICNHCPYVKAVIDSLVKDCADLKSFGVSTIALMPTDQNPARDDLAYATFLLARNDLYESEFSALLRKCSPDRGSRPWCATGSG